MIGSVRQGWRWRGLALAGGCAWAACAVAQEAEPPPDPEPAVGLEQALRALDRIEEQQQALRRETEALGAQRPGAPGEEEPALARYESGTQALAPEIEKILGDLARLEAEQQAVRQQIEALRTGRDPKSAMDPDSATAEEAETLAAGDDPAGGEAPTEEAAALAFDFDSAAQLYEQGREAFRDINFYDAAEAFRNFLARYPEHEDAGEARYWLGETLYVEGRFAEAIGVFADVIADEASPRREVARLKTGFAWYELGDLEQAEALLLQVRDRNPGSSLARQAQLRLERVRQARPKTDRE